MKSSVGPFFLPASPGVDINGGKVPYLAGPPASDGLLWHLPYPGVDKIGKKVPHLASASSPAGQMTTSTLKNRSTFCTVVLSENGFMDSREPLFISSAMSSHPASLRNISAAPAKICHQGIQHRTESSKT